jgi:GNAT superfamily N-acetyltransferase
MLDTVTPDIKRDTRLVPDGLNFRLADVEDVPALVELGREFFAISKMSQVGAEFCEHGTEKYLRTAIENGFIHHVLAEVDGVIVGGISFYYDSSFYKKPLAILVHFFVTKKYRRTLIGRMLLRMAHDIARDEQACAFISPVNSGSEHINSLGNLLAKGGMRMTGYIMGRSL